jgi:carbon storage regulator
MLVLTRRLGESIILNDNIRVSVVEVKGGRIRLGIEAPPDISVDRQEVHHRRMQFAESLQERVGAQIAGPTNGVHGRCGDA